MSKTKYKKQNLKEYKNKTINNKTKVAVIAYLSKKGGLYIIPTMRNG